MPFASEKQRRWAHANNKPWAKEWDNKYANGGMVMPGLLRGYANGGPIAQTSAPSGINQGLLGARQPEIQVETLPPAETERSGISAKDVASTVADFVPIVGDVKAAKEVVDEIRKPNPNWWLVGALAGATVIGLIPGVGDVAAAAIKGGAKAASKSGKKAAVNAAKKADKNMEVWSDKGVTQGATENALDRAAARKRKGQWHQPIREVPRNELPLDAFKRPGYQPPLRGEQFNAADRYKLIQAQRKAKADDALRAKLRSEGKPWPEALRGNTAGQQGKLYNQMREAGLLPPAGYAQGGKVMKGLMDSADEDLTITRKMKDGSSMTMKSPQGSKALNGLLGGNVPGRAPTPVADNQTINVTPGEFVVNYPAAQKHRGLLEQINNEGRQMLAQGGWTKNIKRPGYALGGPFAGYGNYNPQQFQQAAQTLNNPGAQRPPQSIQQRVDAGQAFQPTPEDMAIAQATSPIQQQPAQQSTQQPIQHPDASPKAQGTGPLPKVAKPLVDIVKNAKSKKDVFGNLEKAIDKAESKRDSMMLIAGSLSLLNGDGMQGALGIAEKFGQLSSTKLNQLYEDRERILADAKAKADQADKLEQIRTQYGPTGGDISTALGGSDDYTTLPPASYPKLSANQDKIVSGLQEDYQDSAERAKSLSGIADEIVENPGTAGIAGVISEKVKDFLGQQNEVSVWKKAFTKQVNEGLVNNLPPGVASDRDIDLVKDGFPDSSWKPSLIKRWVDQYQRALEYIADRDKFKSEWVEKYGRQTGWEPYFEAQNPKWYQAPAQPSSSSAGKNTTSTGVSWSKN